MDSTITKKASELVKGDLIIINNKPCEVKEVLKEKKESSNSKVWIVFKEIFSVRTSDVIVLSGYDIIIANLRKSVCKLILLNQNGYASIISLDVENGTEKTIEVPMPYDNEKLFLDLKRSKLKNPEEVIYVELTSYKQQYHKISAKI